MLDAKEMAARLRGCVTASGGIDCCDPQLLRDAADLLDMASEEIRKLRNQIDAGSRRSPGPMSITM